MVSGLQGSTYLEKLKEVGLTTLEDRRACGDMLLTWRAQSGNLSIGQSWFTPCEPNEQMETRHSLGVGRLTKPRFNLDIQKNFFTVRAVDPWNSLPSAVKTSPTINKFKEGYDDYYSKRHGNHV